MNPNSYRVSSERGGGKGVVRSLVREYYRQHLVIVTGGHSINSVSLLDGT